MTTRFKNRRDAGQLAAELLVDTARRSPEEAAQVVPAHLPFFFDSFFR